MHIDHINISAPMELLKQVRDFYCQVFDLKDGFRPSFSQDGFWLYAEDRPLIHLAESGEHHSNERQGFLDHIAFRTTGLSDMLKRLDAMGVEYRTNHLPDISLTQIFCIDPCGTGLEISFANEPE